MNPQPIPLVNGVGSATGDTTTANNSNVLPMGGGTPASPSCTTSGWQSGRDVVFTYTLSAAANVTVTATPAGGSSLKPIVYVRAPNQCASISGAHELGCDNPGVVGPAAVTLSAQAPGTYSVWVDSSLGTFGAFNVTVATCNATTCPTGCCDGTACVTNQTATACGKGGGTCVSCGFNTCDPGSGMCVGDAGFPPLAMCSPACGAGQCCDGLLGFAGSCVGVGASCPFLSLVSGPMTCMPNGKCQ